jgi:hypothetical protein
MAPAKEFQRGHKRHKEVQLRPTHLGKLSPLGLSHPSSKRIFLEFGVVVVVWDTKLAVLVSRRRSFQRNDFPYSSSNGVRPSEFGVFLSQVRDSSNSLDQRR